MTVRELRHLLFNVENQDATIVVPTKFQFGTVVETKSPSRVETPKSNPGIPEGFVGLVIE